MEFCREIRHTTFRMYDMEFELFQFSLIENKEHLHEMKTLQIKKSALAFNGKINNL